MKRREFLATTGAVPLMLAGCGGDGSGSAPVRLVNASLAYPSLGFRVNTTQATDAIAYGSASPLVSVEAGTVTTELTVLQSDGSTAVVSTTTRTINKDTRYSMVAYGFTNELRSVLIAERTDAPTAGFASINALNTSSDIGQVDIYISTAPTSTAGFANATLIVTGVGSATGASQSAFASVTPGTYYISVVGRGSVEQGTPDIRFQGTDAISFTDQEIATIILAPGVSGTLANVVLLVQGDTGSATLYSNPTSRLRVVASVATGSTVAVTGVLAATASPAPTGYAVVASGAVPVVTVDGNPLTTTSTLVAGGDYTLMIYTGTDGNPTLKLLEDDNTAPVSSANVKMRLINMVYNPDAADHSLGLSLYCNFSLVASNLAYSQASTYVEIPAASGSNGTTATIELRNGTTTVLTHQAPLTAGFVYTDFVVGTGTPTDVSAVKDFFFSSTLAG
jgi:hypothetical protein